MLGLRLLLKFTIFQDNLPDRYLPDKLVGCSSMSSIELDAFATSKGHAWVQVTKSIEYHQMVSGVMHGNIVSSLL